MAFPVGTLRHNRLKDVQTPHLLAELEAAVCSEAEADSKVTTHKSDASAHHVKTTDASEIASGRFGMAKMPDMTSGKIMVGQGSGTNPVEEDKPATLIKNTIAGIASDIDGATTDSIPASYLDNLFDVAEAASIFDSTSLTTTRAKSILDHQNLSHSKRRDIKASVTRFFHFWLSAPSLNTARYGLAGCGTQAAGLSFGGYTDGYSAVTEEYDGVSWSGGGSLGTARSRLAGCGTQTAGLSFGGYYSPNLATTEEYDGTSWSAGGNLATARRFLAGCGTQTAALSFGGYADSGRTVVTEEYDGTSWSAGGNLGTARHYLAGCGTQTAALNFGGYANSGLSAVTEEYDGSSWSAGGSLVTARYGLAGCGIQNAGLSFGGSAAGGSSVVTEEYDGTAWSAGGSMATARYGLAGCGAQNAGVSFGGFTSGGTAATEEYW